MLLPIVPHIAHVVVYVMVLASFHVVPLTATVQVTNQRTRSPGTPRITMLNTPATVKKSTPFMTMIVSAK